MPSESWRSVAEALAARMKYQAYRCPVGSGIQPDDGGHMVDHGDVRHVPEEHVHDCPFCADTVAYKRFLRKHREGNVGPSHRK